MMFRKTMWRKAVSDAVSSHQHRALNTTIFILKEFGPIGFLLKEDGDDKHYKVCLGDPHTCTCPTFQKEKDLCTHICWILMRKFRLPQDHEYCFQYGLAERQILELLQGLHVTKTTSPNDRRSSEPSCPEPSEEDGSIRQKDIEKDDICPICQEELLLKKLPVTYCKFSCGNNIHISCMKVWADHQIKRDPRALLKCPLCREDFGTFKQIIEQVKNAGELLTCYEKDCLDKHLGVMCNNCRVCPIIGKCFKCTECSFFHLCEDCFRRTVHPQHCFMVRMKRGQPWQTVEPHISEETQKMENHSVCSSSSSMSGVTCDVVPNYVMKSLPIVRVRRESRLLYPGVQCRICLSRFQQGQHVRTLPCKHKFHTGCIDPLLRKSNCCPLDWHVIYNPLTWNPKSGRTESSLTPSSDVLTKRTDDQISEFFLPGIGLHVKRNSAPSPLRIVTSEPGYSGPSSVDSLTQGFRDLCINSSHIEPYTGMSTMKQNHTKEQRSLHRSLSVGKAITAQAERRESLLNRPSATCLNTQSALARTQNDQQRLAVGINGSSSITPAFGRIRPLRNGRLRERPRPNRVDVKDLHLWMTNSPVKVILMKKRE
ncbi:E3 ubiquitin-protein ligase ZSWIM2 [Cyprinus carpio]|uniref:E3 ubiquitin-protein ligase ZSWIM2 n=1 Tax=Cyprinus carpio TaxID=7962 RepID=A0A9Q9VBY8_CYPCA|nr:E3 ubiquitin-protein ligase ZSWIM2 [Cyprinus carpio]